MAQNKSSKSKVKTGKLNLTPFWNILAILMLLGACCVSSYVLLLVSNPNLPINPFPPPLTATPIPTSTPTLRVLPATWTPTPTYPPMSFGSPIAISTLPRLATQTQQASLTPVPPTATIDQPTTNPAITLPTGTFFVVDGLITPIPSTRKNPESGCDWLGVGGVVTDPTGNALIGMTLILEGYLGFDSYNQTTLSGAASQYGPGGYEFYLGGTLSASQGSLFIQILGDSGQPVSERIAFDTYSDCQKNLVLINFRQIQ
jgi:hypothetical protein